MSAFFTVSPAQDLFLSEREVSVSEDHAELIGSGKAADQRQHGTHRKIDLSGNAYHSHTDSYDADHSGMAEDVHDPVPGQPAGGERIDDENRDEHDNETIL